MTTSFTSFCIIATLFRRYGAVSSRILNISSVVLTVGFSILLSLWRMTTPTRGQTCFTWLTPIVPQDASLPKNFSHANIRQTFSHIPHTFTTPQLDPVSFIFNESSRSSVTDIYSFDTSLLRNSNFCCDYRCLFHRKCHTYSIIQCEN